MMDDTWREPIEANSLLTFKRKPVRLSQETLVRSGYLTAESGLPLLMHPESEDVDLLLWARANREVIRAQLLRHGAILFRRFNIDSINSFEKLVTTISPELMRYSEPSTPRTEVSRNIYISTDYPAD